MVSFLVTVWHININNITAISVLYLFQWATGKDVWMDLDKYRPILPNIILNICRFICVYIVFTELCMFLNAFISKVVDIPEYFNIFLWITNLLLYLFVYHNANCNLVDPVFVKVFVIDMFYKLMLCLSMLDCLTKKHILKVLLVCNWEGTEVCLNVRYARNFNIECPTMHFTTSRFK